MTRVYLALASLAVVVGSLWAYGAMKYDSGLKTGYATAQAEHTAAVIPALRATLNETERRLEAQQKADDAKTSQLALVRADADRSLGALQRLRERVAQAASRGASGTDPAAPAERQASTDAGDALVSCATRHRQLALDADADRASGQSCERRYDALIKIEGGGPPAGVGLRAGATHLPTQPATVPPVQAHGEAAPL